MKRTLLPVEVEAIVEEVYAKTALYSKNEGQAYLERLLIEATINAVKKRLAWQPIETAPKDGKKLDLWVHGKYPRPEDGEVFERIVDCFWAGTGWRRVICEGDYKGDEEAVEVDAKNGWTIKATHWMRVEPPE